RSRTPARSPGSLREAESRDRHKLARRPVTARTCVLRSSRALASTSRLSTWPVPVLRIKRLFHSFRDVLLEVVDLRFLGAESAPFPGPRVGAFLGSFTDRPILAIDQIPDVHRVAGVEVRPFHHV